MNYLEICCGSYEDALNAYRGNADRIELNSALQTNYKYSYNLYD